MTRAGKHILLWLILLAIGLGGTILLFLLRGDWGFIIIACPFAITCLSVFKIRKWYRQEPISVRGSWQLRLTDLLGAVLFIGALFAVWKLWKDQFFLQLGIPTVSITGVFYVGGLLWSSKKGVDKSKWKAIFAAGFSLLSVASLAIGGLITLTVVWLLVMGEFLLPRALHDIFTKEDEAICIMLRWPLTSFPVALFLFLYAWKSMPRSKGASTIQPGGDSE